MAKRKKTKENKKYFTIVIMILFIGSILGFALFSRPNTTQAQDERIFLNQNIFETKIDEKIQSDVMLVENPNTYPEIPIGRTIGGIWIEYSCSDCVSLVNNLSQIVTKYSPRVYISPDTNNTALLTLMSWAATEELNDYNQTAIEDFICSMLIMPPDSCALREI